MMTLETPEKPLNSRKILKKYLSGLSGFCRWHLLILHRPNFQTLTYNHTNSETFCTQEVKWVDAGSSYKAEEEEGLEKTV